MDELERIALEAELAEDIRITQEAVAAARIRFDDDSMKGFEACAFHMLRAYNGIENIALRVTRAFEGEPRHEHDWHAELIHRLTLTLPKVRPHLFDPAMAKDLKVSRGFRHVLVHA